MNYELVEVDNLNVPEYKTTYILRPDLLTLAASLETNGFIIPLVVHRQTMDVIDGSERMLLARNQKTIRAKCGGMAPVVYVDCDKYDAMMLHIQLNRGRGSVLAKPMSKVIKNLIFSGKESRESLNRSLCVKREEFDLMIDSNVIKHRKITEHKYSRAWVPVEAPSGTISSMPTMETPPNEDR
jgi:hypothetical protein